MKARSTRTNLQRGSRKPAQATPPAPQGQTRATTDNAQSEPLPLPHERDQSARADDKQPRDVMRQAKADLDAGLVDTDMRSTPGLDAERRADLLRKQRG